MLGLYREHYADFTVKHFHEQLVKRHHYTLGYTVTKLHLHHAGLVKPAPRRSAHRKKRPRRPLPGMLLHQDASRHGWLDGARRSIWWLPSTTPHPRSTRRSSSRKRGRRRVSAAWPRWWRPTPVLARSRQPLFSHAGGRRQGVAHPAHPGRPGARAARHRAHRRLFAGGPRPLGAGLPDAAGPAAEGTQAGRHHRHPRPPTLSEVYLPEHNARFAVPAEQEGSAFVADAAQTWREILCIRMSARSATTTPSNGSGSPCRSRRSPLRPHFVRAKVRVHEYPHGRLAVFWGPHRLADYDAEGRSIIRHALAA